ncbi:MAG: malto-oligosyltrehalose synthase [Chitinophagaceae bacterium]|nr:malto-oligosyltrehalose synthase [Chitinophagaceae bacterium]
MQIPSSTYRIQFNPRFTFNHLAGIIDYLDELGITAIYASPILQPAKGSEHGYDGINPAMINPELGTMEEFEVLSSLLQKKGMGWIQDIVPNHLAFDTNNVWLKDVLERGINSSFAKHFDIDWEHPFYQQKLMVPFLEAEVAKCLEENKLTVQFTEHGFFLTYYNNYYPINVDSYPLLLSGCFDDEFNHVNAAVSALLNNISTDIDHWKSLKQELIKPLMLEPNFTSIQEKLALINNDAAVLSQLLSSQHYVLCKHTLSHTQINYRRFFNVNGLICLRIEDEQVFNDYHRLTYSLYEKGIIHGLRVDHIDGLKNPREYLDRLRSLFGRDCYIIVEKVLDVKEELPASLDIQGTSGYEFLSYINQVLTDNHGAEKLLDLYKKYVPDLANYEDIVFANKLSNLESYLNGEWDNLLRFLLSLNLIEDEEIRLQDLKMALGAFMCSYPVYRAYVEQLPMESGDENMVAVAFEQAAKRYPQLHYELGVLRQLFTPHPDATRNNNRLIFIQRLMQFTGPIAAKGVEDTTFYQYNPLISHNEVGDQPCVLGIPLRQFHEKMQERIEKNPLSINCTSTHDTKRGEDARIRINIISELADEWAELIRHWQEINEPYRKQVGDTRSPIVNDEYFLYQAITGAFPEDLQLTEQFVTRTKRYFTKVLRESKMLSNYIEPNLAYEEACAKFIDHLLNPTHQFLPSMMKFVKKLIGYANIYTMVQVIIKTTAPGIPDIYQGCELWDLSYVDPDNRRPVDYILRKKLLNELNQKEQEGLPVLLQWANENYEVGTQKLFVTKEILQIRKLKADLFLKGEYIPLYPDGGDREVIAYLRHFENDWILVVVPLGVVANTGKSLQIKLPPGAPLNWHNIFTGENIEGSNMDVHELFKSFPVAVLEVRQ